MFPKDSEVLKYHDRTRVRIKALLLVVIFAIVALVPVYYLVIKDIGLGPPSEAWRPLSEAEKLEILEELGKTNKSTLTSEERQQILDQFIGQKTQ